MNKPIDRYVKNTMNFKIIQTLMSCPYKWMTAADISRLCGNKGSRSVSHKLTYIMDEFPGIECRKDSTAYRHQYRYNPERASVLVSVPLGRVGS